MILVTTKTTWLREDEQNAAAQGYLLLSGDDEEKPETKERQDKVVKPLAAEQEKGSYILARDPK